MNGYFGSKATSGLCQPIISMMPPHDTYIETQLGGGTIMRRKPSALNNIAIDLDLKALNDFSCDYTVEKVHGCAHQFLSKYDFRGRELVYCVELLEIVKNLPCLVMLSGYPSTLYEDLLTGWKILELQVKKPVHINID